MLALFSTLCASSKSVVNTQYLDLSGIPKFTHGDTLFLLVNAGVRDSIVKKDDSKKEKNKKKLVSALFAFPFPLGFMGAHRVMLGTAPWVPVVYVATFGGCFGILPLIDFFVLSFSKDTEQYENNPNIFMWLK
ncbi:hypothetical protein BH10BAC1_BH10BAC1_04040 [soil metagenome]